MCLGPSFVGRRRDLCFFLCILVESVSLTCYQDEYVDNLGGIRMHARSQKPGTPLHAGQWEAVFGEERSFGALDFAVEVDGPCEFVSGVCPKVCIGVAPYDFIRSTGGLVDFLTVQDDE